MSARNHKPTKRGNPPPPTDYSDDGPTSIYDSGDHGKADSSASSSSQIKQAEASQPIRTISMKTPANPNLKPVPKPEREMPHVRLRAMSEVAPARQPQNLGNLAPPYDPAEARKRSVRDYVLWGSLAVILASAIALAVWLVAS